MSTVKFMMGLITPTVISGGIKKTVKVHRISPAHTSRVFTKLYFTFCRLYYRSAEFILHGQLLKQKKVCSNPEGIQSLGTSRLKALFPFS
jgi:hypothetical protein